MEPTGIIVDFLQRAMTDREAGQLESLESYQALYPGYEALIAEEYAELIADDDSTEIANPGVAMLHPRAAFEGAWRADRSAGRRRTLAEYLALIPGDPAGISARHAELVAELREPDPAPELPGSGAPQRLGSYRLLEEIGRGGQGLVYRAEDLRLGRLVALKILSGHGLASPDAVRRFTREAEVASRLDDPGICAVYDAGAIDGTPYIAMRYVEGETLAASISRRRSRDAAPAEGGSTRLEGQETARPALSETVAEPANGSGASTRGEDLDALLTLIEKVARSLHRAHEDGVVHRDLKPGNIMVTPAGDPVILDFGLAAADAEEFSTITRSGDIQGTLPYMSPEQVAGRVREIDRRTDVYALGATLYEAVTLRRPFTSPTREALMRAIEIEDPPDPRRYDRRLPRDLKVVLETALAKDADRRYATALDLAEDLRRLREREPIAARPISSIGRVLLWARRRPAVAALVASLMIGIPVLTGLLGFIVANLPAIEAQDEQDRAAAVDALVQTGYAELGDGSLKEARRLFGEACARMPDRSEVRAGLALTLCLMKDHRAALALLEERPDLLTRHRGLRELQADTLGQIGRAREARAVADTLGRAASADDFFLAGFLRLYRARADDDLEGYREAFDLLSVAVHTAPQAQPLYHFELAHAVGHLADLELATPVARGIAELWPKSARAWYWVGHALSQADPPAALEAFDQSVKIRDDIPGVFASRCWALYRCGRGDEAIASMRRAIELAPEDARFHGGLSRLLFDLGHYEEVLTVGRHAVELNPRAPEPLHDVAASLDRLGRWDEAEATYRRFLALAPEAHDARCDLANTLLRSERFEEALTELDTVLATDPDHLDSLRTRAMTLAMMGDEEAALAAYESLMTVGAEDAHCQHSYGSYLSMLGEHEDAEARLLEALRLDPTLHAVWYDLGLVRGGRGDEQGAAAAYRASVERRPDHAESWCNLGHCLRRLGRYREAVTALERGHALGTARGADWPYPSSLWLSRTQELLEGLEELEAALSGKQSLPKDPEALRALVGVAETARRPADAVRIYRELFAQGEEKSAAILYAAARAAARAAVGATDRQTYEDTARDWLSAALEICERESERGGATERRILRRLEQWRDDPLWASFTDPLWTAVWESFEP